MVNVVKEVNERVEVVTTRQTPPGLRKLYVKAVIAGGG